jgi:hypothetical protein
MRLHKTGTFDFELEKIPISEIEEIYVLTNDISIITFNNGKPPMRTGNPDHYTEQDFDVLPPEQKKLLSELECK